LSGEHVAFACFVTELVVASSYSADKNFRNHHLRIRMSLHFVVACPLLIETYGVVYLVDKDVDQDQRSAPPILIDQIHPLVTSYLLHVHVLA
jgi:hypothetical protein